MKRLLAFLTAAAMIAPVQAAAPTTQLDLTPAGKWRIDYADDGCVLSRDFTSGGQPHKVALTFEPVTPNVWMTLHSPDRFGHRDDGDARVEIDGVVMKTPVHFNVFKDTPAGSIREYWLKEFNSNVARTRRSLRLDTGRYGDIRLDFVGFAEAMKSVETCVDDLHRSLGIDPAVLKGIAVRPVAFGGSVITLPEFQNEFKYQMLFWVTPSGRVDECHLLAPTGKANFDKNACEELKKNGRFKPAKNAAGEPIRAPVYENADVLTTVIRN